MDYEDLQKHAEAQSAKITEQDALLKKQGEQLKTFDGKTAIDAAELKTLQEKAAKADEYKTTLDKQTVEKQEAELKAQYPQIPDWSVVKGSTIEEKKAHAEALSKHFDGKAPPAKPEDKDAGKKFGDVPPLGAPNADALTAEEKSKRQGEMYEAMKKGDHGTVLDNALLLQATKPKSV